MRQGLIKGSDQVLSSSAPSYLSLGQNLLDPHGNK